MASKAVDKVIVTHKPALRQKYQVGGLAKVDAALKALIAADAKRGLVTAVVDLASAGDAKKHKFKAVPLAKVADARQHKQAIDKLYKSLGGPAYLVLLGATDVIPQVPLENTMAADGDEATFSDLPYACDAAYSLDPRDFIAPSRVVGRLPDVTGGGHADYLVGLIETAAGFTSRPAVDYAAYFALSAKVWQESTAESLDRVFGDHKRVLQSPPVVVAAAPPRHFDSLSHFINCHGGRGSAQFFGQATDSGPMIAALDASQLKGNVSPGAVVSAECCYGADLYDPAVFGSPMGICNAYLAERAYGFFGSSTIAYGPPAGNDLADLVCQFFLKRVREGSSLGRACLQARVDYLRSLNGVLTPTALKTLAQFSLLGDPAVVPVLSPAAPTLVATAKPKSTAGVVGLAASAVTQFAADRLNREGRRDGLRSDSSLLAATAACVTEPLVDQALTLLAKGGVSLAKMVAGDRGVGRQLKAVWEDMRLTAPTVQVFGVRRAAASGPTATGGRGVLSAAKSATAQAADRVHLVVERTEGPPAAGGAAGKTVTVRGFEAVESNGILQIRKFVSR
jgi:Peptidase family C25